MPVIQSANIADRNIADDVVVKLQRFEYFGFSVILFIKLFKRQVLVWNNLEVSIRKYI